MMDMDFTTSSPKLLVTKMSMLSPGGKYNNDLIRRVLSIIWVSLLISSSLLLPGAEAAIDGDLQVIYAVNAGGYDHTDKNGILYESDPLNVGTASDYGNHLLIIGRVAEQDEVLYRTERYHTATFGYDLPLEGDGTYALVLKFCEVYFNEPNMKVGVSIFYFYISIH